jgi:hypothetical protein
MMGLMTVIATLAVANGIERAGSVEASWGVIFFTFPLAGVLQIILGGGYDLEVWREN